MMYQIFKTFLLEVFLYIDLLLWDTLYNLQPCKQHILGRFFKKKEKETKLLHQDQYFLFS